MKHLFKIFIIVLISSKGYTQTVKGVIKQSFMSAIGDDTKLSEKEAKPLIYSYIYSDNKSIQKLISENKSSSDTTYVTIGGEKIAQTNTIISPSYVAVYKDFVNKKFKRVTVMSEKEKCLSDKLPTYEWKLDNAVKEINGFKCKKATTIDKNYGGSITITAWYCEEISINDGPKDYNGLPGFIIQLDINNSTFFTFEKLVFLKENTVIEEPVSKVKSLTFIENQNAQ